MRKNLRDRITGLLVRSGFKVEAAKPPLPPDADWGLDVSTPPPFTVNLRIFHFPQRELVVVGIGIGFAEQHRAAIAMLTPEKRAQFAAKLLTSILSICSHCRVALHPNPFSPERVVVEEGLVEEPEDQRILDSVSRLVNVFIAVNSVLWEWFPETAIPEGRGAEAGTPYM